MRPSALEVLRFTTSSNLVGCSTGPRGRRTEWAGGFLLAFDQGRQVRESEHPAHGVDWYRGPPDPVAVDEGTGLEPSREHARVRNAVELFQRHGLRPEANQFSRSNTTVGNEITNRLPRTAGRFLDQR